jgi:hypothetical protein
MFRIYFILIVSLLTGIYLYFINGVGEIDCRDKFSKNCSQAILLAIESNYKKPPFLFKKEVSKLPDKYKYIKDVQFSFEFPDKMNVLINQGEIGGILLNIKQNIGFVVNTEGYVVDFVEPPVNYSLQTDSVYNLGDEVGRETKSAMNLIQSKDVRYGVESVILKEDRTELYLKENIFYLPHEYDAELISVKINLIFKQLNDDYNDSKISLGEFCSKGCIIDLRLNNPVIKKI